VRTVIRSSGRRIIAAIAFKRTTDQGADVWSVGAAAACATSEFDPSIATGGSPFGTWFDASGAEVSGDVLSARDDCYNGTQVMYHGHLFVRIPGGGVDESQLVVPWSADVPVPGDAIDTGLRSGDLVLYRAASGGAIYVVAGDSSRGERLPHVIGDEVIRTDCN
jgi:hypothetical protein